MAPYTAMASRKNIQKSCLELLADVTLFSTLMTQKLFFAIWGLCWYNSGDAQEVPVCADASWGFMDLAHFSCPFWSVHIFFCNADTRYSFLWTGLCGHILCVKDGKRLTNDFGCVDVWWSS